MTTTSSAGQDESFKQTTVKGQKRVEAFKPGKENASGNVMISKKRKFDGIDKLNTSQQVTNAISRPRPSTFVTQMGVSQVSKKHKKTNRSDTRPLL